MIFIHFLVDGFSGKPPEMFGLADKYKHNKQLQFLNDLLWEQKLTNN